MLLKTYVVKYIYPPIVPTPKNSYKNSPQPIPYKKLAIHYAFLQILSHNEEEVREYSYPLTFFLTILGVVTMSKLLKMSAIALAFAVVAAGPISTANAAWSEGQQSEWTQLKKTWNHTISSYHGNSNKIDRYLARQVQYYCDRDRDDCGYAIQYAKEYCEDHRYCSRTKNSIMEEVGNVKALMTTQPLGLGIFSGMAPAWGNSTTGYLMGSGY